MAAAPAPTPQDTPSAEDSELGVLDGLKRAEHEYGEGLADFRAGRDEAAHAHMRQAFAALGETLDEDGLALELRPEFMALLEKVRAWDTAAEPSEAPTDLDADAAALAAVSPAQVPAAAKRETYSMPIDPDNETVKRFIALYTEKESRRRAVQEALGRDPHAGDLYVFRGVPESSALQSFDKLGQHSDINASIDDHTPPVRQHDLNPSRRGWHGGPRVWHDHRRHKPSVRRPRRALAIGTAPREQQRR